MTARNIRVLAAIAVVFAMFVYGVSLQLNHMLPVKAPDEGQLGGPIPGLTRWQLSKFQEGRELFRKKFAVSEGLGPLYNGTSCADCHGGAGVAGGAGPALEECSYIKIARRKASGRFAKDTAQAVAGKVELADVEFMPDKGGPVLIRKSIAQLTPAVLPNACQVPASKDIPRDAEYHCRYCAPQVFGLGMVNAIDDIMLNYALSREFSNANAMHGKAVRFTNKFWQGVGRFGLKCEEPSLYECIGPHLGRQIGISNPLFPHSLSATGQDNLPVCAKNAGPADPNVDGTILNKLNFYLLTLAPPPRGPITPEVRRGEAVFDRMKCSVCHVPSLKTANKVFAINPDSAGLQIVEIMPPTKGEPSQFGLKAEPKSVELRALEKKDVQAYSDFLVHDMGSKLADGIPSPGATGGEWRTAPLWGLRYRKFYLHDGRAANLQDAITAHGGQAAESEKSFEKLTRQERLDLLAFLNSL